MKRKIILAGSALAGIIAVMIGYFCILGAAVEESDKGYSTANPPEYDPELIKKVIDMELGGAQKIEYPVYVAERAGDGPERKHRLLSLVRADSMQLIEPGRFRLARPQVFYFFRNGVVLRLRAEEGEMFTGESAEPGLNPRHGEMTGNVVISMMQTRRDRPASGGAMLTENIRIRMDRLRFNYIDNYVDTDSIVTLTGAAAEAEVRGVRIHWNGVTQQITDLQLNTGFDQGAGLPPFRGRMLAKRTNQAMEDRREERSDDGPPAEPAVRPDRPTPQMQTYRATFNHDVDIRMLPDPLAVDEFDSQLTADRTVTMFFDFEQQRPDGQASADVPRTRQPVRPATDGPREDPEPPGPPTVTAQPVARARDDSPPDADNILVTWSGLLRMVPAEPDEITAAGPQRRIVAEGQVVRLRQQDGRAAICTYCSYDDSAAIAEIRGAPAVLTEPANQTTIICQRMLYDGRNNRITLFEKGSMQSRGELASGEAAPPAAAADSEPARLATIEWDSGVEILLYSGQARGGSRANAEMLGRGQISEAAFTGNVRASQQDSRINAESMTAYFFPPGAGKPNQISRLVATARRENGKVASQVRADFVGEAVQLADGEPAVAARPAGIAQTQPDEPAAAQVNSLLCDRIELLMKLSADGESAPDRAIADGNVRVEQESSSITAGRVELSFAARVSESPGRPPAVRYVPHEARAFRDVVVVDASRNLRAQGSQMHALLTANKATLHGNPAQVKMDDRLARGPIIQFDRDGQAFHVLGESVLSFKSDRDLSGRPLAEPMFLMATSRLGMSFDGRADVAELRGGVRAASERDYIQGEFIRMTFQDAPPPEAGAAPATPPATDPDDAGRANDPLLAGLGQKRLRTVVAERDVIVRTMELNPANRHLQTRMEVRCGQLIFDNVTGHARANGAGSLLLEDYRPAPKQQPAARPAGPPVPGAQLGSMRPSQTQVRWTRQMHIDREKLEVVFDGVVRMGHRNGEGLIFGPDGTIAIRQDVPITVLNCDRLTLALQAKATDGTAPADDPGLAAMADTVEDLKFFRADKDVVLTSGARTLLADFLEYRKDSDMFQFGCHEPRRAEVFDIAADGSRFNHFAAPRIQWDMATGKVEPFEGNFMFTGGN